MNIVFVTTLYPDNDKQALTEVPFTLHYFVKNWVNQGHSVQVVKVEAIYPRFIPKYSKLNKVRKERDVLLDGVNIHVVQVKKKIDREFSVRHSETIGNEVVLYLNNKDFKCDVVVFHVFQPSFYIARLVKKNYRVPLIYGIHQTDLNWVADSSNCKELIKNKNYINAFAYRSNALKEQFNNYFKYATRTFLIPSGVPRSLIQEYDICNKTDKQMNFVTVANMIKRKNIDIVIKSFKKLVKIDKNIRLTIIGDGIDKKKLEELVLEMNLDDSVFFLGQLSREKVFFELGKSDVFVLPSVNETFGIVYLEAMAKNCICIGTINEGIDGIIVDGINGYLCSADVDSCFLKMQKILKLNHDEKREIHNRILKTILKYTEQKCSTKYIEHLTRILDGDDVID